MYDESKRLGETLVSHFVRQEGLNGSIVRIFNTYGPGMDPFDGRVVSTFVRQALTGEPFTVFGDGSQTRSFCYVDDLVRGVVQFSKSVEFGPLNLGTNVEVDLISLGLEVAKAVGVDPQFQHLGLPEDDPRQRRPDLSLATKLLGWKPVVALPEGLGLTANWMREVKGVR
jgi:nucleoside-diphosphate-sugar epimerase